MGFNIRARTPLSSVVLLFLAQTSYTSMRPICNESSTEEMPWPTEKPRRRTKEPH